MGFLLEGLGLLFENGGGFPHPGVRAYPKLRRVNKVNTQYGRDIHVVGQKSPMGRAPPRLAR
jgi:hypothetical protein